MQYFIYKYRRYLLLIIIIVIYILISSPSFASGGYSPGGGGTWYPDFDTDESSTSPAPTFGIWVCSISFKLTSWLPSTPYNMWLSTLVNRIGQNIPFVGRGILLAVVTDIKNVLILVASWKIFKSLSRF